jgi:hypothetical protein
MSAINVLTLPGIFDVPQTCCECVCGQAEIHVPVIRTPIVTARWTVEINGDGARRLVERWFTNQQQYERGRMPGHESAALPLQTHNLTGSGSSGGSEPQTMEHEAQARLD